MPLTLGVDISVKRTNRNPHAFIVFYIRNLARVNNFMQDQARLEFLRAPVGGQPLDQQGCNVNIEIVNDDGERVLRVQRRMNANSLPAAACMDLLSTLRTYICPEGADPQHPRYQDWVDVATGLSPYGHPTPPEDINLKNLPRGEEFVEQNERNMLMQLG